MHKKIDKNNLIFKNKLFIADRYKYFIALKIISNENALIYSDEETYIIMQSEEKLPIWIWNKNDINQEKIEEIFSLIKEKYNINSEITCKKELYDELIKKHKHEIDDNNIFYMGSLHCDATVLPKMCDAYFERASISDIDIIADYLMKDNLEMKNKQIPLDKATQDAKGMIDSKKTFILRNIKNKIVSIASFTVIDDLAKINHVYTPPEERRKGYCANLMYGITNMLLGRGITPVLYTDNNYLPSNKSYMNVGYVKDGVLITFKLKK